MNKELTRRQFLQLPFQAALYFLLPRVEDREKIGSLPKILILGDSITAWTGFPESIRTLLSAQGYEADFIGPYRQGPIGRNEPNPVADLGIGGYTTIAFCRELKLNPAYGRPKRPEVLRFFTDRQNIPDIAILELGINDVGSGFATKITRENLTAIINFFRQNNPLTRFVLTAIPPFVYRPVKDLSARIINCNQMYQELADTLTSAESPILFAPYPTDEQAAQNDLVPPTDYPQNTYADGIHPNEKAAKTMAFSVVNSLAGLLVK